MDELRDKRIFVVDDDVTNIAVFSATLRRSGAQVFRDIWNSGVVLHVTQYLPLDIIVLDLMLRHQISGYDVFDELKKIPALANVPCVIVSAADAPIEIPKAKARGLNGFISKPIKPKLFPLQIARIIQGEQVWDYPQDALEEI